MRRVDQVNHPVSFLEHFHTPALPTPQRRRWTVGSLPTISSQPLSLALPLSLLATLAPIETFILWKTTKHLNEEAEWYRHISQHVPWVFLLFFFSEYSLGFVDVLKFWVWFLHLDFQSRKRSDSDESFWLSILTLLSFSHHPCSHSVGCGLNIFSHHFKAMHSLLPAYLSSSLGFCFPKEYSLPTRQPPLSPTRVPHPYDFW